jgi:type II secretory pathway component PulJ
MSTMKQHASRQAGFGLVEMMIGILVGLIVVAAATSMLSTTMASSNDNIKMTRLDQEMRQVMTMLSRDLKRATLWDPAADVFRVSASDSLTLSGLSGSVSVTGRDKNGDSHLDDIGAEAIGGTLIYKVGSTIYRGTIDAFDGSGYQVTLTGTWPTKAATADGVPAGGWNILRPESAIVLTGSCILITYDYDANEDGDFLDADDTGRFGYRYDATNDAVDIRTSATGGDSCTSGTWENLTDDKTVQITAFSVTDNSPATVVSSGFNVNVREYTISITGNLKTDTSVERTLQETIRVRNDQLS